MKKLAFVWENFGPMHLDRIAAVAAESGEQTETIGIELFSGAGTYGWARQESFAQRIVTLFEGSADKPPPGRTMAWRLVRTCMRERVTTVFLCGHGLRGIFLSAICLRLLGRRVVAMNDSKFDDKPRSAIKELVKSLYYAPYSAALAAGRRSAEYFRFLGFRKRTVEIHYDNISIANVRAAAGADDKRPAFSERPFLCVARYVEKKNHAVLLRAYAQLSAEIRARRALILCGSGPLESALRTQAEQLGIASQVVFTGWEDRQSIARRYRDSLCLILPSTEEQFGIVVLEALAMGLPVLVSDNVGARDLHVQSTVNGFFFEPDNVDAIAWYMRTLAEDEHAWQQLSQRALDGADRGDVAQFVRSVARLAG
jgi:L-malate glycosyltransferase